ncbi:hypothetical protein JVU11DRAFT_11733 [Chiua virens]|nr:hypothetical protein JVU11DRAFT_11733 [Chiua virens]
MSPVIETLRAIIDDIEKHLQSSKVLLLQIAKEGEQVRTLIEEATVPRDRFKKRVAIADAFFGPKSWDELATYGRQCKLESIGHPWNFLCMQEHLLARTCDKLKEVFDLAERLSPGRQREGGFEKGDDGRRGAGGQ